MSGNLRVVGLAERPRILFVLKEYSQIHQTCIKNEIEALEDHYEIRIVTSGAPASLCRDLHPHDYVKDLEGLATAVQEFRPHVLHTHCFSELQFVRQIAEITRTPYTARIHSLDTTSLRGRGLQGRMGKLFKGSPVSQRPAWAIEAIQAMDSDLCLGVLILPCARPWLVRAGAQPDKLIDCFPVVRVRQFMDRGPNGDEVMNPGCATTRRATSEFRRLANMVPGRKFRWYAQGDGCEHLQERHGGQGSGVEFVGPVRTRDMPSEYKKHRWLVFTENVETPASGWPIAVAEAQASGVGVCIPSLRTDLAQYVGSGAGVLYDSVEELPAIVAGKVPKAMRERGFEQAKKYDIERHKHLLTDLWESAIIRETHDTSEVSIFRFETTPTVAPVR
ncbi:hypothetical protein [Aurantiacibacter poecillastricola]|uniref:hypothetical protein n=1 Tax=Aurantiacibacter poecillastricola TaxID=3064385 RepID=UPI00273F5151|nr:hypothetical protein [Aurantiacibacter sp. 219JJ12-13]MDP5263216.1 hypothetical protein [Aurantiacibacter sp. 219JJ12-13]